MKCLNIYLTAHRYRTLGVHWTLSQVFDIYFLLQKLLQVFSICHYSQTLIVYGAKCREINTHEILNILDKLLCTKKSYLYMLEWHYKAICDKFLLKKNSPFLLKKKKGIGIYFNKICSLYIFNGSAAHDGTQFIVPTLKYRGLECTAIDSWHVKVLIFPFLLTCIALFYD